MKEEADIGIAGLAVIGANLALNFESKGYTVALYNRTAERLDDFMEGAGKGTKIHTTGSIPEFLGFLKRPRKILMAIRAGRAVDDFINTIRPHLEPGDILMDAGNSYFKDTMRRMDELLKDGIRFVGLGVSGGEEGALHGPSIMAGCSERAWEHVKDMLTDISAKVGIDQEPCCAWLGAGGAGHFVKMIHNGIEYADMQMIAEVYAFMRDILRMSPEEMSDVFANWSKGGELSSYLITITSEILKKKDPVTGKYLVDVILDSAGQKGTGKWTSEAAFDLGVAAPTIAESVYARIISSLKDERMEAYAKLPGVETERRTDRSAFLGKLRNTLIASKICAYAQGFALITAASKEFGWKLDPARIAEIWRGGCIIRASFLDEIVNAYKADPKLENILLAPYFKNRIGIANNDWREVLAKAIRNGVAVPAIASTLAYYDSYRTAQLPANIIQALRDYFGAHMFERVDKPRGEFFHAHWSDSGMNITSTDYNV